jgi:hypothetical protein
MLREFKMHPADSWRGSLPWGGGHTVATDPTKRGWRMIVRQDGRVAFFGQPGVKGCFLALRLTDSFDCHLYDEMTVEELMVANAKCESFADGYHVAGSESGWALPVIAKVERLREMIP